MQERLYCRQETADATSVCLSTKLIEYKLLQRLVNIELARDLRTSAPQIGCCPPIMPNLHVWDKAFLYAERNVVQLGNELHLVVEAAS